MRPAHLFAIPLVAAGAQLVAALRQGRPRAQALAALLEEQPVEQWATLAQSSSDPVIASWAGSRCDEGALACRQAQAATWYRLDPKNAEAVLAALGSGVLGPEEAMVALDAADRAQSYVGAMSAEVAAIPMPGVLPYIRTAVLGMVWNHDSQGRDLGGRSRVLQLCLQGFLSRSSASAERCTRLATLLMERSDSLRTYQDARFMGMLAGGPNWKGLPAEQERRALVALKRQATDWYWSERGHGCAAVEAAQRWTARVAQLGEMGALRALQAEAPPPR